jgi:hypothetical protein
MIGHSIRKLLSSGGGTDHRALFLQLGHELRQRYRVQVGKSDQLRGNQS